MSSILMCSTPVHGHVTPLLVVSRHLVSSGHRVRFLSGQRYRDAIIATGAEFVPLPADADYDDSDMDASFPGRVGLTGIAGIRHDLAEIFLAPGPSQLKALDAALRDERSDAVLAETLFTGAGLLALRPTDQRPIVINLSTTPLSIKAPDLAPFGLGLPPMPGLRGRLRNSVLRLITEKIIFRAAQKQSQRMVRAVTGTASTAFVLDGPSAADGVIQFSVEGFEYMGANAAANLHYVGPVSRATPGEQPLPDWWSDLDGKRPVVHVTQGTIANNDWNDLVAPTIAGLAGEDVLVVVSTCGRALDSLPQPLPDNVRAAKYLPYDRLLPLTDVMVTNGGYGGVHYALEHGVGLVVAGATEDKPEVAARVAWSGVGVRLSASPSSVRVAEAVLKVLTEPKYRLASAALGAQIATSSGLEGIERVISTMLKAKAAR